MGTQLTGVAADVDGASAEARMAAALPLTGPTGEPARSGAPGVSNVRPRAAMPLMTAGASGREGAAATGGPTGAAGRALELARPFLRLVENGIGSDGGQRAAAPRFFEQSQPLVTAQRRRAPAAASIVEAVRHRRRRPPSDDRVTLADLTLISVASATQQVAASQVGGGPARQRLASPRPQAASAGGGGRRRRRSGSPARDRRPRAKGVRGAPAPARDRAREEWRSMGKLERAKIYVLDGRRRSRNEGRRVRNRRLLQPQGVLARQVGRRGTRRRRSPTRRSRSSGKPSPMTLSVTLQFDTYEERVSVRDKYVKSPREAGDDAQRSAKDGKSQRPTRRSASPPVILFVWGRFTFKGVVESLSQKYTMFLADGTPVRAECALKMRNVLDSKIDDDRNTGPAGGRLGGKSYTVKDGDRLDSSPPRSCGDASRWAEIAMDQRHRRSDDAERRQTPEDPETKPWRRQRSMQR